MSDPRADGPAQATQVPPAAPPVSPAAPPAAPPPPAPAARRKPPYVVIAIVGIGFLIGAVFGVRWWMHRQAFVSTEDAQVAGDIIAVSPRVAGRLAEVAADEGQSVKAGQVIARLDDADFRAQLAQAEAGLAIAKTNLRTSQSGVTLQSSQNTAQIAQASAAVRTARAALATAIANDERAHADLARLQPIYVEGGVAKQTMDTARTTVRTADSGVESARAQVAQAEQGVQLAQANAEAVTIKQGGVETVQAQIQQAQAAVDLAKLNLSHTVVTAPVDGMVVRRAANLGEQVAPGQALFSLAETSHFWITAYVEETNIRDVAPDAHVDVHVDAFPGQTFNGHVSHVNAVTGAQFSLLPANNASGNFTKVVQRIPVRIEVEDPNHLLKPGMSATIEIQRHQGER